MMKMTLSVIVLATLWACGSGPRPIDFGKDACAHCKMTLMDARFGGELISDKGKIYVFDDFNCMLAFQQEAPAETMAQAWVINYANPGELIPADRAFFYQSGEIKSPMASGTAALISAEKAAEVFGNSEPVLLSWAELAKHLTPHH